MKPDFVDEAFDEKTLRLPGVRLAVRFKVHALGDLNLPSGRVIACDPYLAADGNAFRDAVAPGRYPVSVSIAASGNERRVAFAKLEITTAQVRDWRQAKSDTYEFDDYGTELSLGYGVDSAAGCFMDANVQPLMLGMYEQNPNFHEVIDDAFNAVMTGSWECADFRPDPNSDLNIMIFVSGWGDGFYSSYFGLDEAGDVVCLVTDFRVLEESYRDRFR